MAITYSRGVWINRVNVCQSCSWSAERGKMDTPLSPYAPENYLVSRDEFTVPSAKKVNWSHTHTHTHICIYIISPDGVLPVRNISIIVRVPVQLCH